MSTSVLDRWALELQQFDIKFQYIQGKQKVAADAISRLRILCLYDNDNKNEPSTIDNVVKNIIKEINSANSVTRRTTYNVGKLNLGVL